MNIKLAEKVALSFIQLLNPQLQDEIIILTEATITKPYGWVFFYNSVKFIQTGKPTDSLAGNAPILVLKNGSGLISLGTALPTEKYLEKLEKTCLTESPLAINS